MVSAKLTGAVVRLLGKLFYWLAVLAISIVLLILLVRFFESRDASQVEGAGAVTPAVAALTRT